MTPQEIKSRLTQMGLTQGDLHRAWKESRTVISLLCNRKLKSDRLERKLARKLGVSLKEFRAWPPQTAELISDLHKSVQTAELLNNLRHALNQCAWPPQTAELISDLQRALAQER